MLMGSNPFNTPRDADKYFHYITRGNLRTMLLNGGFYFSEECMDMMQRLLTSDIKERLSLEEAINHPWVQMDDAAKHSVTSSFLPQRQWID